MLLCLTFTLSILLTVDKMKLIKIASLKYMLSQDFIDFNFFKILISIKKKYSYML